MAAVPEARYSEADAMTAIRHGQGTARPAACALVDPRTWRSRLATTPTGIYATSSTPSTDNGTLQPPVDVRRTPTATGPNAANIYPKPCTIVDT
jgi:hypothetical protein